MMKIYSLILLSAAASLLCAAPLSDEQAIAKGSSASAALLQKLGGEVKSNMQANGPVKTVEFCSNNALAMTENQPPYPQRAQSPQHREGSRESAAGTMGTDGEKRPEPSGSSAQKTSRREARLLQAAPHQQRSVSEMPRRDRL